MTEPTDATISPADFGDAFDAWIGGATLSQKSIDIYGNMGLFAEYEQLERELKVAKAAAAGEEASMEDSRVADIEQRMLELYDAWMASKSTWTVRGITQADSRALSDLYPEIPLPADLPAGADAETKAKYDAAVAAFDKRSDERNYAILERTVLRIEFADGRVMAAVLGDDQITVETPAITATQLAKLRERLGEVQYIKLIGASKLAAVKEPVIPAPFSRSSSRPDPT